MALRIIIEIEGDDFEDEFGTASLDEGRDSGLKKSAEEEIVAGFEGIFENISSVEFQSYDPDDEEEDPDSL